MNNIDDMNTQKSDDHIHPHEHEPSMLEFPERVTEQFDTDKMSPLSRRKFFALVGASSAFALASCNSYRDKGEIVTYNNKPEFSTMGEAVYYASSLNDGSGILIKTREGRPIKIDGNPEHPINQGKIPQTGHATILDLYDPERLKYPLRKKDSVLILDKDELVKIDWSKADKEITDILTKSSAEGKEIAVISNSVHSPTQKKLFDDFKSKFPSVKFYTYELHNDSNRATAWKDCFGEVELPAVRFDKAKIILALESDFLGNEGNTTEQIRMFASKRDVDKADEFNRLYCAEAAMSLTGMNADYRIRISPAKQFDFLLCLTNEVVNKGKLSVDGAVSSLISGHNLGTFVKENDLNHKYVDYLVKDLIENKGKSLIYAGEKLPVNVHIASNMLNSILGSVELFDFSSRNVSYSTYSTSQELEALVSNMKSGKVAVVINYDSNPVYHFADDYGFGKALEKVSTVISFTMNLNESSKGNKYILPINHALESWDDFNIRTGIFNLQQPVIAPLYTTRQKEAVLLNWLSPKPEEFTEDIYHKYLMDRWEKEIYPQANPAVDFRKFWYSCLHDGFINLSTKAVSGFPQFKLPTVSTSQKVNGWTVMLSRNFTVGDGRYASNGWLQELPHPVTKAAWDNYASISPKAAKEMGVVNNDVIEIKIDNRSVKLPVMLQPGMAENVVAVELGYGRSVAGEVGTGVGHNANLLLSKKEGLSNWIFGGAILSKTGETFKVFSTQEHHAVDEEFVKDLHFKREIVREGTVEGYKKNPKFLKEHEKHHESVNAARPYPGLKWAMAIDMNKCISCTSCVISCNVENNIPVVGKDQVSRGREMHWIRLDRYYSGTPEEPIVSAQPMLCQHCDDAPCENVCPVVATTHSDEGLNQMVYNRCVGTRYCNNNCPYKVRRFNFFNFRDHFANGVYLQDSLKLLHNPEVTVRSRGVMEKCTFCIQRISEARQEATKNGTPLKGSDVQTACQVACPASAISFGDMNDKESNITKLREHNLGYHSLEELNIKPNVTYIAKLRNKHEEEDSANGLHS
jgi:Fe-S-cluster-containing dehydrogenase component